MAKSASSNNLARALALTTPPTSGETIIWSLYDDLSIWLCITFVPYTLSTGTLKNPCIWSECNSMVKILSAPALCNISATNLALIGTLSDLTLLSCLAYPK